MPEYDWNDAGMISQRADSVSNRVWQQPLKIQRLEQTDTTITLISQNPIALKRLFPVNFLNADGFSYGYFMMDEASKEAFLSHPLGYSDPVFRASMWINCWEGLLRADGPTPESFIRHSLNALESEDNPLLIDFLLGNLETTWLTFLPDHQRTLLQQELERVLWKLVDKTEDPGKKNSYFRTYRNLANSEKGLALLESIWNDQVVIKNLPLSEEDKIALAYELALKMPQKQEIILAKQLANTKNPDRQERMRFVMPALSNNQSVRDAFFESLKSEKNREHESWVLEALGYLHHPLRAQSSISYLRPSLDLLQEVQLTGDIFFPQRWLHTTFEGHTSPEAFKIVQDFLMENPDYPFYLKNKILQSTDLLNRSVALKDFGPEKN
jgi:aminopeptidase N